jgi:MFS family permease
MEGVVSDDTPDARPADHAGAVSDTERPATFRDVFAVREYRALFLSLIASWVGEYLSRAAITVLVFQQTHSVLLSAASFAISYLPWIAGGPVLAALAERYPYRRVMAFCDFAGMVLIALVLIPGLPIAVVLVVLFLTMLASPPSQAARSALLPVLLGRDRVVIALAANSTTMQAAQVVGYFAGATLATAVNPRLAIGAVALAYGLSMTLILTGLRPRPAANSDQQRTHLLRETAEGFQVVFGDRVLRPIAQMAITLTIFAIVPEGLAAAWAAQGNPDPATRGFDQAMIMAAGPVGWVIGGVVFNRFVRPAVRRRLVRPLAILAPLALVPAIAAPSAAVVAGLTVLSGIAQGGLLPTLNGQFVLALPHGYRARAFAVIQGGMQLAQGFAVITTGLLAEHAPVPTVVGLWSVGGTVLMGLLAIGWPTPAMFDRAIAAAAAKAPPEAGGPPEPPSTPVPRLEDEDTQPLTGGPTSYTGVASPARGNARHTRGRLGRRTPAGRMDG